MGPSLPTCGVCASSQHPASERNRIVGHPVGAQKVGIRTAADLGKNISQRQSECSANSVPPAWDPSDTLIRPEYRLGLHAARGWRTKSVACAATSFASPDTPDTPTVLLALVSQRSPPRLAEVQGQTAYSSHTKFWVFSRLSFQRAAHMGCWGAGPRV